MQPESFCDAFRRAMRESGMTQMELEERSGVGQPTISKILAGAWPREPHANAIAAVLGLRIQKAGKRNSTLPRRSRR